jgi:hypothetical protein
MKKEQWVDAVINSTRQLTPAGTNSFWAVRVQQKIKQQQKNTHAVIAAKWVYTAAACFAVLLVLNVLSFSNTAGKSSKNNVQSVMQQYGFMQTDYYFLDPSTR